MKRVLIADKQSRDEHEYPDKSGETDGTRVIDSYQMSLQIRADGNQKRKCDDQPHGLPCHISQMRIEYKDFAENKFAYGRNLEEEQYQCQYHGQMNAESFYGLN